jgi:hypothetical protein
MGRPLRRSAVAACAVALVSLATAACSTAERVSAPPATTAAPDGAAAPSTTVPAAADASLVGRVLGQDGKPVADLSISVVRTDTGSSIGKALLGAFTLGLSCLAEATSCGGAKVVDSAVTGADGRYELTLPDAYVAGYETDDDWIVSIGRPAAGAEVGGPSSSYELEVSAAVQEAPDLVLWDAAPSITAEHGQLSVAVPDLRIPDGDATALRFVTADGAPLWEVRGVVDELVLEDAPVTLAASGRADVAVHHSGGRTIYHQRVRSGAVAYRGDLVPPSRGASCAVVGAAVVGCPFTDGDLVTGTSLGEAASVTLDLQLTRDIGQVIVRGPTVAGVVVDGSLDGRTWKPLAVGPLGGAEGVVARSSESLVARYVRVSHAAGSRINEISAWPVVRISTRGGDSGPGPDRTGPIAIAVLLLGAVVVGTAAGRRRIRG